LIKVMLQYWPKQMQHHVACRGLGFGNFFNHRCGAFPLNTLSFRAFFLVIEPFFFTRDN
jgi:hypothetical protein